MPFHYYRVEVDIQPPTQSLPRKDPSLFPIQLSLTQPQGQGVASSYSLQKVEVQPFLQFFYDIWHEQNGHCLKAVYLARFFFPGLFSREKRVLFGPFWSMPVGISGLPASSASIVGYMSLKENQRILHTVGPWVLGFLVCCSSSFYFSDPNICFIKSVLGFAMLCGRKRDKSST